MKYLEDKVGAGQRCVDKCWVLTWLELSPPQIAGIEGRVLCATVKLLTVTFVNQLTASFLNLIFLEIFYKYFSALLLCSWGCCRPGRSWDQTGLLFLTDKLRNLTFQSCHRRPCCFPRQNRTAGLPTRTRRWSEKWSLKCDDSNIQATSAQATNTCGVIIIRVIRLPNKIKCKTFFKF